MCVSKGWLSLLTQPEFIKTHRITLNRNHHIFYNRDKFTSCTVLYSHPFHHHDPYILNPTKLPTELCDEYTTFRGSCDGLVLLSGSSNDKLVVLNPTTMEYVQLPQPAGYYPRGIYLINPTTREYEQLPERARYDSPLINKRNQKYVSIGNTYGIGYDSVTDDYKVITITYYEYHISEGYMENRITGNTIGLSIYSVRSNTWRQLIVDSLDCDCVDSSPAGYVNGFLHWFGTKKDTDDYSKVIVAFSLVDECFSELPFPSPNSWRSFEFVVLGGKLAIYLKPEYANLEVWLMNEYGVNESWTKIPLDEFGYNFPLKNYMIFDDNGKLRVACEGQIMIYDYEKRILSKDVYIWSRRFRLFGSYVESLVSPKRKDTTDAAPLPENLDPICHPICNKSLRFSKILSLRKKQRELRKAKGKNKREKFKISKKSILAMEEDDLMNQDVSLGDSSENEESSGKDFENLKMHQAGNVTFQDFLHDINQ